jgi:hypothetical protein
MTQREIHVGIVGASAKSCAKVSHVPAINGLPGLKLAAVATRNEQSARESAEAFGADRWFSDPFAMIRDERIAYNRRVDRTLSSTGQESARAYRFNAEGFAGLAERDPKKGLATYNLRQRRSTSVTSGAAGEATPRR